MDAKIETITPEIAKRYLSRNIERNRSVNRKWVDTLARMMQKGQWEYNGESIKFAKIDRKQTLIDGQHRLHAIIKSGMTLDVLVIRGVRVEAMATLDTHKGRTAYHILQMRGEKHAPLLAATLRWIIHWQNDHTFSAMNTMAVSNVDVIDALDDHPNVRKSLGIAHLSRHVVPPSMLAFIHYVTYREHPFEADTFIQRIGDGVSLADDNAILAFRNRIFKLRSQGHTIKRQHMMGLLVKTWNAYYGEKPTKKIRFNIQMDTVPRILGANRMDIVGVPYPCPKDEAAKKAIAEMVRAEQAEKQGRLFPTPGNKNDATPAEVATH